MEIIFLVVGLCFFGIGLILLTLQSIPKKSRKTTGQIIGYTLKGNLYNPIFTFKSFNDGDKFGRWPISSSYLTHSIGEKIKLFESPLYKDRVWPINSSHRLFGKIFLIIGILLILLFFKIYKFTPLNMLISAGVLGSLLIQFLNKKFIKPNKLKKMTANQIYDEIKSKAFTMDIYNSLEEAEIKLEPRENLLNFYKKQKKIGINFKRFLNFTSIILIVVSLGYFHKRHKFLKKAENATATLVDFKVNKSSKSTTYYPIYEFQINHFNQTIRANYHHGSSHPSKKRGEKVKILYNPDDHYDLLEDDGPLYNYLAPGILFLIGIVLLFAASKIRIKKLRL